jgi:hypothetical protein
MCIPFYIIIYVIFSSFIKIKTREMFIWINEWLLMIQKI